MEYVCRRGHETVTPEPKRVDHCLVAGCPAPQLTAYGEESQAENRRLKRLYIEEANQAHARLFAV
jgi:hypothetical protein